MKEHLYRLMAIASLLETSELKSISSMGQMIGEEAMGAWMEFYEFPPTEEDQAEIMIHRVTIQEGLVKAAQLRQQLAPKKRIIVAR